MTIGNETARHHAVATVRESLVIFGALVLLVGCGSQPPAPATVAAAAPSRNVASLDPVTPSAPPRNVAVDPVAPVERTYLAALLHQIDPGLVDGHANRAIDNGRNVCEDFAQSKGHATVVKNAALRFGADAPVDQAKAEKIVATIEASRICKP
ncbi:DUF732 domain-containing protein [Amycolatopsis sp. NPDC050768]|uniref:DUF732 domain-containing protein n=1 Tax=Amycolatopsis sp. NPDC050768 TaxID=3154839 RepID=UPI0033D8EA77